MATTYQPDTSGEMTVSQRTALEARAGLESIDTLQAERRAIVAELAPLEALHGHDGMWDAWRRQMRGAIGTRIRETWTGAKAPSNEAVEDAACADPEYASLISNGLEARVEYLELKNRKVELDERIRAREMELLAYNAELRLER